MAQPVNGDLTVGSPGRKLLRFALPIIFINLLQAVYNVADMIIIGHWADAAAMAAVSTGGAGYDGDTGRRDGDSKRRDHAYRPELFNGADGQHKKAHRNNVLVRAGDSACVDRARPGVFI